jgi:hypothetical protein
MACSLAQPAVLFFAGYPATDPTIEMFHCLPLQRLSALQLVRVALSAQFRLNVPVYTLAPPCGLAAYLSARSVSNKCEGKLSVAMHKCTQVPTLVLLLFTTTQQTLAARNTKIQHGIRPQSMRL